MAKAISKASDVVAYRPKPSLSIDAKDLPAIKDWKIGKSYQICVEAKMVSISSGDEYDYDDDGKRPTRARFVVTKVTEK